MKYANLNEKQYMSYIISFTKRMVFVGFVIIGLVFVGAGCGLKKDDSGDTDNQETSQSENGDSGNQTDKNDQDNDQDNIGEIDTSDWKTYRNEEYGFEVKYPEEWVKGGHDMESIQNDKSIEDFIFLTNNSLDQNKVAPILSFELKNTDNGFNNSEYSFYKQYSISGETINIYNMEKKTTYYEGYGYSTYIPLQKRKGSLYITVTQIENKDEARTIFFNILSTLKI